MKIIEWIKRHAVRWGFMESPAPKGSGEWWQQEAKREIERHSRAYKKYHASREWRPTNGVFNPNLSPPSKSAMTSMQVKFDFEVDEFGIHISSPDFPGLRVAGGDLYSALAFAGLGMIRLIHDNKLKRFEALLPPEGEDRLEDQSPEEDVP